MVARYLFTYIFTSVFCSFRCYVGFLKEARTMKFQRDNRRWRNTTKQFEKIKKKKKRHLNEKKK